MKKKECFLNKEFNNKENIQKYNNYNKDNNYTNF